MMSDAEILRFKPGKRFIAIVNGSIWRIDSIDAIDEVLYVTDDNGFSCRIFTENFDKHHYFMDDLPAGCNTSPILATQKVKCECGSDTYYGVDKGPHSDYCVKYKKEDADK